jgi:hypothetical protein
MSNPPMPQHHAQYGARLHTHTWRGTNNRDQVVRAVDVKLHAQPAPLITKAWLMLDIYLLIG